MLSQGCLLWLGPRGPVGSPFPGLWLGVGSGEGQQGPPTPAACAQVHSFRLPESENNEYPGVTYTELGGRKCVSPWQGCRGFCLSHQSELTRHDWA